MNNNTIETDEVYKNRTSNLDGYSNDFICSELSKFGLNTKTPYGMSCKTILDVACGTGIFSKEFSKYFTVKGEDISTEAIKRANIENINNKICYDCCNILQKDTKHDIVFARGPSFFARFNIYSDTFSKFLDHLMNRCNKIFVFGQYNKEPGNPSYEYHSKEDIQSVFSKYGTILKNEKIGNYIYVVVKKNKL